MSENILEPEFEPMYSNVYYKGALIGMCLDLYLIKYSDGEKDLQWLMRELSKEYGMNQAFKDEELFDKIESLTYPEIGEFLRTYVAGKEPLPVQEVLGWAGVEYLAERKIETVNLGGIRPNLNEKQEIYIADVSQMNEFGKAMGYEFGDVLVSLNGQPIELATINTLFQEYQKNTKPGDEVTVVVRRVVEEEEKEMELKANAVGIEVTDRHILSFAEEVTDEQEKVKETWLSAKE